MITKIVVRSGLALVSATISTHTIITQTEVEIINGLILFVFIFLWVYSLLDTFDKYQQQLTWK